MVRRTKIWMAAAVAALLSGCTMFEPEEAVRPGSGRPTSGGPSTEITPTSYSYEEELPPLSVGRLTTRSLIDDQTTTQSFRANFLRIDEDIVSDHGANEGRGLYTFTALQHPSVSPYYRTVNWEDSYLIEGVLSSSPDHNNLRPAYLYPVQTYKMRVYTDENDVTDTLDFYHTRMVSWHPMTCEDGEDGAPVCKFGETYGSRMMTVDDTNGDRYVAVKFTGLDGQTDVMVSDMREGQLWHSPDAPPTASHYHSNYVPAGHPTLPEGTNIYASPFGHYSQERIMNGDETLQWAIDYDNHFTYKHYLSAIRVFVHAERSPQNMAMWGDVENVVIGDQPTSVNVSLPVNKDEWGVAFGWGDYGNFSIATGRIFGDHDMNDGLDHEVSFPVTIDELAGENYVYLGYALVQPDHDVDVQIHTSAGIYSVVVPAKYTNSNGDPIDIFKESNIYDIRLNMQTNGTIASLVEHEEDKRYYDLTRLAVYEHEDDADAQFATYRYANTYIVSPDHTPDFDEDGNMVMEADGVTPKYYQYDGYCFDATIIGNGQSGILSAGTQTLYPTSAEIRPASARLLWESDLALVTNVELMYRYVRFRVPNHSRRGNAVIAVYDKDDRVLWSWHIWITDPPQEKVFENGDNDIIMLDRNIGALKAEWTGAGDALDTYGLYYQWGRKDPSMGPESYNYNITDLITDPYYDYSSRERVAAEVVQFAKPTLQNGVENPMFLVMPTDQQQSYYFNWTYERNDFLWGYNTDDGSMVKTIYDPCPYGYRVPLQEEMATVFANSPANSPANDYGVVVNGKPDRIYFPYAGYKGVDRDLQSLVLSWNYVGEKGDYMTSTISKDNATTIADHPILDHRGRVYITKENSWQETANYNYTTAHTENKYRVLDFANRRTAGSVRCVKNFKMGTMTLEMHPSQQWFVAGSQITLHCDAFTTETNIQSATLTVRSVDKGVTRVLYSTPAGTPETKLPTWSKEVVFSVGVVDGEFWSQTYEFTLTCTNGVGLTKQVTTTIERHNHPISIDVTKWLEADAAEAPLFTNTNYTREFVVKTTGRSDVPTKATVSYHDNGSTVNQDATLVSSNDAGEHTYRLTLKKMTPGDAKYTIRVVCGQLPVSGADHTVDTSFVAHYELKVMPMEATLTAPTIFVGDKQSGAISAHVESPNGDIRSVVIVDDRGNTLYSNDAVGATTFDISGLVPATVGKDITYTLKATDAVGESIEISATTTVYRVAQLTSLDFSTVGAQYVIEYAGNPDSFLTVNGSNFAFGSLSESVFTTISSGYTVRFNNSNRYLQMTISGSWFWASCSVSAATSSSTVDIDYQANNGFRFSKRDSNTYYLTRNNNSVAANTTNTSYWNIYKVTTN